VSLPSTELSDDSHIYADPSAYDDAARSPRDPVPHLDPARITIDAVIGRSTCLYVVASDFAFVGSVGGAYTPLGHCTPAH